MTASIHLEGTCVAIHGAGVLLLGKSGSGKSDLALRLINEGGVLVADDQLLITATSDGLIASVPPSIAGMLEIRGVGIVRQPFLKHISLALAVELVEPQSVERYPEPLVYEQLGIPIPLLRLHAFEASAPAKIIHALHAFQHDAFAERVNS